MQIDQIDNSFGFHAGTPETIPAHEAVRSACRALAVRLDELVPDGRDKSLAMTNLQQVMHWANSGIAMTAPLAN